MEVDMFLRPKPILVLLCIDNKKNKSRLEKEANVTFSWLCELLVLYKEAGLVRYDKIGRSCPVVLTQKGEKYQKLLRELISDLGYELWEDQK
jgi:predicted transcriptional regulator